MSAELCHKILFVACLDNKLLQQGISNPEFYGDLVHMLRKSLKIQTSLTFSNELFTASKRGV